MLGRTVLLAVVVAMALFAGGVSPAASEPGDCPYISTPWNTPYGDRDCDGFSSVHEDAIGTMEFVTCPVTAAPNDEEQDAWPSDFDDNQIVNITDVVNVLPPYFGSSCTNPDPNHDEIVEYTPRRDLFPDCVINITDVYKVLPPFFGSNCRIAGTPPAATTSRYMDRVDPNQLNLLGCLQGIDAEDGIVVLDFGQPWIQDSTYGTKLFDDATTFASIDEIETAAVMFALGYWQCSPSGPYINVVIGTNNFHGETNSDHGEAWAELVNRVNDSIFLNGLEDKVIARGGSDIELGWASSVDTRAWVDGYDLVNLWRYLDYGNAAGCQDTILPSPETICEGDWTHEDVWYVSWGAAPAWPLPQTYLTDGVNGAQWQNLSLYAATEHFLSMSFKGTFTQWQACQDVGDDPDCDNHITDNLITDNLPAQGWTQLRVLVEADSETALGGEWDLHSTDVTWDNEVE